MRRAAWVVLGLLLCCPPVVAESEPRLRWHETVDVDGKSDFATTVLVQRNRVLLAVRGRRVKNEGERRPSRETLVVAYSPSNGRERWRRRYANDRPLGYAPSGRRTVVTLSSPTGLDVFHAKTGASLWSWEEARAGGREAPLARATKHTLYTAAVLPSPEQPFNGRILIQARGLSSGQLLWEVWEPWSGIGASLGLSDRILDLVPTEERLFGVGVRGEGSGRKEERFVRAFDAVSGDHLWTDEFPTGEFARVLGASDDAILVAGNRKGARRADQRRRLVVRALDAASGLERWRVERGETEKDRNYYPEKVLVKDGLAVVVGFWSETRTPFDRAVFVIAFDRDTGTVVWEREVSIAVENQGSGLSQVELSGGALLIAYRRGAEDTILALTPQRGRTLWEIASPHFSSSLATQARKRLFVAGTEDGGSTGFDAAVSAYRLPPR